MSNIISSSNWGKSHNDAGAELAELAKRSAFQKSAEGECRSQHPIAYNLRNAGVGGKKWRDCVAQKMARYDEIIAADKAKKNKAEEEASLAFTAELNRQQTEAETKQLSVKTELVKLEKSLSPGMIAIILFLFTASLAGGVWYYNKSKAQVQQ